MKNIKNLIATFVLALGLLTPVAVPAVVSAQIDCDGIDNCLDEGAQRTDPGSTADAEERVFSIIETVIDVFSIIVGVISVIMIIIGGLKYITSGGDSGNVSGAKNTILYAIIGLVVVALAQVIVRFVLQTATNA